MGASTKRLFPSRALRPALAACAVLAGSLVFSAAEALAAEGGGPVIGHVTAAEVAEHEVKVEAQIDPEGLETAYEVRLVWQVADPKGGPPNGGEGELPTGGPQTQTGNIAADSGDQNVSATLTGLQWGYTYYYVIAAINSAGKTKGESPYSFALHISGEFPNGSGTGPPFESEIPVWLHKLEEEKSKQTLREYEAKHTKELEAQHTKEREEQVSREAAARTAEALAAKEREQREQDHGGLSLAGTSITVQRNGDALVRLTCPGIASCRAQLTLTATSAAGAKGKTAGSKHGTARVVHASTVTIATAGVTIAGDETRAVEVKLNVAGRALLRIDHKRLAARLAVLELAPAPKQTLTKGVRLVLEKARGKTEK